MDVKYSDAFIIRTKLKKQNKGYWGEKKYARLSNSLCEMDFGKHKTHIKRAISSPSHKQYESRGNVCVEITLRTRQTDRSYEEYEAISTKSKLKRQNL